VPELSTLITYAMRNFCTHFSF